MSASRFRIDSSAAHSTKISERHKRRQITSQTQRNTTRDHKAPQDTHTTARHTQTYHRTRQVTDNNSRHHHTQQHTTTCQRIRHRPPQNKHHCHIHLQKAQRHRQTRQDRAQPAQCHTQLRKHHYTQAIWLKASRSSHAVRAMAPRRPCPACGKAGVLGGDVPGDAAVLPTQRNATHAHTRSHFWLMRDQRTP